MNRVEPSEEENIQAIVAHLKAMGVFLPESTNRETIYHDLLIALETAEAMGKWTNN